MFVCLLGETAKTEIFSWNLLLFVQIQVLLPCWMRVWGCSCSCRWFAACPPHPDPHPESAGGAATSRILPHPQHSTRRPRSAPSSTWPSSKVARAGPALCCFKLSAQKCRFWLDFLTPLPRLFVWAQWIRSEKSDPNLLLTSRKRTLPSGTSAFDMKALLAQGAARSRWCVITQSSLSSPDIWTSRICSDTPKMHNQSDRRGCFQLLSGRNRRCAHTQPTSSRYLRQFYYLLGPHSVSVSVCVLIKTISDVPRHLLSDLSHTHARTHTHTHTHTSTFLVY